MLTTLRITRDDTPNSYSCEALHFSLSPHYPRVYCPTHVWLVRATRSTTNTYVYVQPVQPNLVEFFSALLTSEAQENRRKKWRIEFSRNEQSSACSGLALLYLSTDKIKGNCEKCYHQSTNGEKGMKKFIQNSKAVTFHGKRGIQKAPDIHGHDIPQIVLKWF